jgi:hypothetical protein
MVALEDGGQAWTFKKFPLGLDWVYFAVDALRLYTKSARPCLQGIAGVWKIHGRESDDSKTLGKTLVNTPGKAADRWSAVSDRASQGWALEGHQVK